MVEITMLNLLAFWCGYGLCAGLTNKSTDGIDFKLMLISITAAFVYFLTR